MSEDRDQERGINTDRAAEIEIVPREPSAGGGAEQVEELERTAGALRDDLGVLVDELGRRGKRMLVPAAMGAAALAALGVGGLLMARRRARRQLVSRPRALLTAVGQALSARLGFEKQKQQPRPLVRIGAAAGAAAASVVARWAARQLLERLRTSSNVQAGAARPLLGADSR